MKKQDGYELTLSLDSQKVQFEFTSIGSKGRIEKVIEFNRLDINRWNLGFGDVKDNDWTDNVVSNNDDWRLVLQTVANAIHLFFDNFPDDEILIVPLDHQRKLLYNRIFQQKWHEIDSIFRVKAVAATETIPKFENYTPSKLFNYFVISRKNSIFE